MTNTVSVTNPGSQSNLSGTAITALQISATDTQSGATLTYSATGLPVGTLDLVQRKDHRYADGGRVQLGDRHGHRRLRLPRLGHLQLDHHQHSVGDQPGQPVQRVGHRHQHPPDQRHATPSRERRSPIRPPVCPRDCRSTPRPAPSPARPTTAGSYSVTAKATDGSNFSGTATFTWTITNTVSVTNPGNQSNVSGTAISTLQIGASDTSSTATLSYSDNGTLPPGLAINTSTGAITGTPTTAGSYSVTIKVTDNAGYSAQKSFTWTITNTLSVTNPGAQSDVSGTDITPLTIVASDSSSTATLSYSDNGTLPPGSVHRPLERHHHRFADHRRHLLGDHHRRRQWRFLGQHHVHLDHHQHGVGDQSGQPVQRVGHRHQRPSDTGLRFAAERHADLFGQRHAAARPGHRQLDRSHHRHPDDGRHLHGDHHRGGQRRLRRPGDLHLDHHQHGVGDQPGQPVDVSGTAISGLSVAASDSSSTATISYSDDGTLPPGLAVNAVHRRHLGTPTTAGSYPVTITVTDNAGFTGSTSFTWTITNTVSVTSPGNQSERVGYGHQPLPVSPPPTRRRTATFSYADGGTLPPGWPSTSSTGAISGTPTTAGSYPVTITVTDNAGFTGIGQLHLDHHQHGVGDQPG